jgi:hypothetical protein
MKIGKLIAILGILAMTAALVYGFTIGDFGADGALILANPWGIVSLVDLYTGFVLFSMWIYFRESNLIVAIIVDHCHDDLRILYRCSICVICIFDK